MSKPVVFSLLAMACYAVASVILEQRFAARFNNLTIMCFYAVPIFLVGFVGRQLVKTADPSFDLPAGFDLAIMIAMGFIFAAPTTSMSGRSRMVVVCSPSQASW
jgi:hypothetical protein